MVFHILCICYYSFMILLSGASACHNRPSDAFVSKCGSWYRYKFVKNKKHAFNYLTDRYKSNLDNKWFAEVMIV